MPPSKESFRHVNASRSWPRKPASRSMGFAFERETAMKEQPDQTIQSTVCQAFEDRHYPVAYWARLWGFSAKTVREWVRDEYGTGILRLQNIGRRSKRDYTTLTVSASAAARVYAKHTSPRPWSTK